MVLSACGFREVIDVIVRQRSRSAQFHILRSPSLTKCRHRRFRLTRHSPLH